MAAPELSVTVPAIRAPAICAQSGTATKAESPTEREQRTAHDDSLRYAFTFRPTLLPLLAAGGILAPKHENGFKRHLCYACGAMSVVNLLAGGPV